MLVPVTISGTIFAVGRYWAASDGAKDVLRMWNSGANVVAAGGRYVKAPATFAVAFSSRGAQRGGTGAW